MAGLLLNKIFLKCILLKKRVAKNFFLKSELDKASKSILAQKQARPEARFRSVLKGT
jgi:hypothetical protein